MDEIYNKSKDSYKVGKLIKNVVLECLTDTTIHALPNIRKLMFMIVVKQFRGLIINKFKALKHKNILKC